MRILIAYDGSGYSHAALGELQRSGLSDKAEVLIVSVSEIWLPPVNYRETEVFPDTEVAEYFQKHREQADRNLAEAEAIVLHAREELLRFFPDWNIKTEAVTGSSPAREILTRAIEFNTDIIIIGAQGLSSNRETGLGSIAQKVLAGAKCSVRIARLKPDIAHFRLKIMIGFDGSHGAMAAVETVAFRTWKTKPEICLLIVTDPFVLLMPGRVFQPIPGMSEGRMKGEEKWGETLAANALQILRDAGLSVTLNICSGNPRMILVSKAEKWNADSVFIGANSFELQPEFYSLGCVASAVAARAHCSVEVVRKKFAE